ncbi:YHS domain-containing (seleno)protein [Stappia stellulata]|uniref:YHS domain-containing (seleno)protein n=1 Tax=Stappia stellulata TaxID=71235 RepID=UPI00041C741C|nr:YHS domain-containing (seleno)protein [Stappia stellulata]
MALFFAVTGGHGAVSQDYATDVMSGYALGGRDPVAYFVAKKPREGLPRHELRWAGTIWVFVNEGNRAAFEADPEVYAPHLAGCDPVALADGFVTAGNPMVFALYEGGLLLFHSEINRFLFLADPKSKLAAAEKNATRLGCGG